MNPAKRSFGVGVGCSEKMICVECFRAKGDEDLKMSCQNPRCHFYLRTPSSFVSSRQEVYPSEPLSPSFNKEVGYDRKSKPYFHEDYPSQLSSKEWHTQPFGPSVPVPSLQKMRSKSTSTSSSSGDNASMQKLLSASFFSGKEGEKHKYLRSRYVSLPEYSDSYLGRESQLRSDLVEDAFVSSPLLMDYGERVDEDRSRFSVADTDLDCGLAGPFGRSTGLIDWMDNRSTSKAQAVPAVLTVPSTCASTSTFDMTQLKMEMTKAINSQMEHSLATNGRVSSPESSELLKQPSMNGITGILGLGGLLQCTETYSRKVFVGGLPPEIDEDDIRVFFMRFGSLTVDWPHKNHNRGCIPPKGYAFLLFKNESSVHKLLLSCKPEEDKHFIYMPTSNLTKKKVQIRPWYVADSYHTVDPSKPIDPRKAVFVGGVPRPLKASELAEVMSEKYGNVALIVIDSDSDLKYPKGAACVVFSSHASYIAAVSARFMQLNYGSLDKKVEIKPYVLDGQMCDECTGVQCNGKAAPFFCGSVTCLQYYCEYCWATVHSMPGRQNHRPLLKDIGDKARFY